MLNTDSRLRRTVVVRRHLVDNIRHNGRSPSHLERFGIAGAVTDMAQSFETTPESAIALSSKNPIAFESMF